MDSIIAATAARRATTRVKTKPSERGLSAGRSCPGARVGYNRMRIVISSHPKLLNILRCVVRYRAQEVGFPETDVDWLTMAIDEAATNVMRHAYKNSRDGKLELEI